VLYVVSAIGSALAWNWPSLMVFRFVGGLGIGASSVLGPVYIAELAPAKWRGRLVGAFQFNVVFGILVAYTSNYAIRTLHLGAAEWRWQVGVAAIPASVPGAAVRHSAQPALVGLAESHRRSAGRAEADGRAGPAGEAGRHSQRAGRGARNGARAGLPLEVPLSAVSGHFHRRVQSVGGHQRDSLLPEQTSLPCGWDSARSPATSRRLPSARRI
jgi:MFS family permease